MLQQFAFGPDEPDLTLVAAEPVQTWLVAAADALAIRVGFVESDSRAQVTTGERARIVHVVRSPHGQVVAYAAGDETWGADVWQSVEVDALAFSAAEHAVAIDLAATAELVGAAAVQLTADGAARLLEGPQASAAWTLDACQTSVFENHVRALLDLPLGSPQLRGRAVASQGVGWAPQLHSALRHCFARDRELRVHLYGTTGAPGMRIGHVTVVADDMDDARRRAQHAAQYLTGTIEE